MSKVTVAFLKEDNTISGKLIKWWTKGPYSHAAIVIDGMEYSASAEEGGVYKRPHSLNYKKWDYVEVKANSLAILNFYTMTQYDRYDFMAIFGFIMPFKDRSRQWDCSEWVSNALKISGVKLLWTKEPSKISPNHLYSILI